MAYIVEDFIKKTVGYNDIEEKYHKYITLDKNNSMIFKGELVKKLYLGQNGYLGIRTMDDAYYQWKYVPDYDYYDLFKNISTSSKVPSIEPPRKIFKKNPVHKIAMYKSLLLAIDNIHCVYAWGNDNENHVIPVEGYSDGDDFEYLPIEKKFFRGRKIIDVIPGGSMAFAISLNGNIYSWGTNNYGELGRGNDPSWGIPSIVHFFDNIDVKKIVCGENFAIAIDSENKVYSWGSNKKGTLGIGSQTNMGYPTKIDFFDDKPIKHIKCGQDYVDVMLDDGRIFIWGYRKTIDNSNVILTEPTLYIK